MSRDRRSSLVEISAALEERLRIQTSVRFADGFDVYNLPCAFATANRMALLPVWGCCRIERCGSVKIALGWVKTGFTDNIRAYGFGATDRDRVAGRNHAD